MLDRLKNILPSTSRMRRIDSNEIKTDKKRSGNSEKNTPAYRIWGLMLPVLIGFATGRLASVGIGYGLDFLASDSGVVDSAVSSVRNSANDSANKNRGFAEFVSTNPFHISPMKVESNEPAPAVKEETPPPEPPKTLDGIILRGTFPGISAWFDNKGKLELIMVGSELEKFKLASVNYREAIFTRGNERIVKQMVYGPVPLVTKTEAPKPVPKTAANTPAPDMNIGNVIAAAPDGQQEGQVSSELVSQLVQNPFDELKRIRIRPNETAGGLEVQWIQNESILKRLGVQKGDIIRSVNGIPFTNMGDIANSINSLMNSERFDVEVTRGGKPAALRYVVK